MQFLEKTDIIRKDTYAQKEFQENWYVFYPYKTRVKSHNFGHHYRYSKDGVQGMKYTFPGFFTV